MDWSVGTGVSASVILGYKSRSCGETLGRPHHGLLEIKSQHEANKASRTLVASARWACQLVSRDVGAYDLKWVRASPASPIPEILKCPVDRDVYAPICAATAAWKCRRPFRVSEYARCVLKNAKPQQAVNMSSHLRMADTLRWLIPRDSKSAHQPHYICWGASTCQLRIGQ